MLPMFILIDTNPFQKIITKIIFLKLLTEWVFLTLVELLSDLFLEKLKPLLTFLTYEWFFVFDTSQLLKLDQFSLLVTV